MQQLGGLDASFLYMETPETPMHVGGLYLYELPPGYVGDFYDNFRAQIASRMHLFPVFTRKLMQLPLDIDTPLWVRDEDVDLDYHIRRYTLPKPGSFDQLEELVGRLHSNLLDRSRPLWEVYIIEGLNGGRMVEYTKFHHAAFDGAAAMAFVQNLYDTTPIPRPVPPPHAIKREDLDPLRVLSVAYANGVRQYVRAIQSIPQMLAAWTKLALPDANTLRLEPIELPPLAPWTSINVSITSQRRYAARTVSLNEIKRIAKANGVTVNDVVLAMCGAALRRYLKHKGELPKESLTAFVPVSVRDPTDTQMNNQVLGMIVALATHVTSPHKRLQAVHESAQKAKRLTDTIKAITLGVAFPWGAPFLLSGVMNLLGRYHLADNIRPLANLTVSNNIGSPVPLYIAGAKLLANYPINIPTHGSALNITVQSYVDNLDIGLIACRRAVPDLDVFADEVVAALEELKSAPPRRAGAAKIKSSKTPAPQARASASNTDAAPNTSAAIEPATKAAAQIASTLNDDPRAEREPVRVRHTTPRLVPTSGDTEPAPTTAPSAPTSIPVIPEAGGGTATPSLPLVK